MNRLRDLMTSPVLTFATSFPASDAWDEMRAERVQHAVALDHGSIRGVVSTRDLGGIHGGALRVGRAVGELMRQDVIVASPDMSPNRAAQIMREQRIGCLPVVQHGKLVGMITATDLLRTLARARRPVRQSPPWRGAADLPRPPAVADSDTHPRR